jgi:glutamate racemase
MVTGKSVSIGVFDSGIGGLSVLQALRSALPQHDVIYLADSGFAPYGERSEAFVVDRSLAVTRWLVAQGIEVLVVACNTATAAAIAVLRMQYPDLPIVGVEPALKPAVTLSRTGHIGVMATRNTLNSAKYQALLAGQNGSAVFTSQPCDGLASAIEVAAASGDSGAIALLCEQHIGAMGGPSRFGNGTGQMDTLVLGCTHYPFANEHLQALVGPDVQLVDNGTAVARQTQRLLSTLSSDQLPAAGALRLLSTGEPGPLQAGASRWLGVSAAHTTVEKLSI